MKICSFYIKCMTVFPQKADAPLIVDGYRVLFGPVTLQGMELIAGGDFQIIQV